MAKKVVATLKSKDKSMGFTKLIRSMRNPKTGAYSFREEIVPNDRVEELIKEMK